MRLSESTERSRTTEFSRRAFLKSTFLTAIGTVGTTSVCERALAYFNTGAFWKSKNSGLKSVVFNFNPDSAGSMTRLPFTCTYGGGSWSIQSSTTPTGQSKVIYHSASSDNNFSFTSASFPSTTQFELVTSVYIAPGTTSFDSITFTPGGVSCGVVTDSGIHMNGTQVTLGSTTSSVFSMPAAGLRIRFQVGKTQARAKWWAANGTEPATWNITIAAPAVSSFTTLAGSTGGRYWNGGSVTTQVGDVMLASIYDCYDTLLVNYPMAAQV